MSFRRTKSLACVGVIAVVALVAAGCGSSSSSSSKTSSSGGGSSSGSSSNGGATAPGVTATSITFGTHQPLTGTGGAGLQRDRARVAGVLRLRQRPRRRVRAQDPPDHQGRRLQPDQHRQRRPPAGAAEQRVRDLRGPRHADPHEGRRVPQRLQGPGPVRRLRAARAGTTATTQPYTFGWQPNYTIEGKILGQYIKQHFAGQKVGVLYQDDDFGKGGLARHRGRGPGLVDRVQAALPAGRDHARAADHRDQVLQGARCWSTSPSRSTPRSAS